MSVESTGAGADINRFTASVDSMAAVLNGGCVLYTQRDGGRRGGEGVGRWGGERVRSAQELGHGRTD